MDGHTKEKFLSDAPKVDFAKRHKKREKGAWEISFS